jgi:hypothetical protein
MRRRNILHVIPPEPTGVHNASPARSIPTVIYLFGLSKLLQSTAATAPEFLIEEHLAEYARSKSIGTMMTSLKSQRLLSSQPYACHMTCPVDQRGKHAQQLALDDAHSLTGTAPFAFFIAMASNSIELGFSCS